MKIEFPSKYQIESFSSSHFLIRIAPEYRALLVKLLEEQDWLEHDMLMAQSGAVWVACARIYDFPPGQPLAALEQLCQAAIAESDRGPELDPEIWCLDGDDEKSTRC